MEVKLSNLPKSRVKLEISAKPEETKKFFDLAYEKLSKNVEIKGFRPGKAPRLVTIETIGEARYKTEALNIALPSLYYDAVKKENIIPVESPKVEVKSFDEDKNFEIVAEVDVLPKTKLGNYKDVKIKHKKETHEATDDEVSELLKKLRYQQAKFVVINEAAKSGDKIEVSFIGKVKGVVTDKYTSKHFPFILGDKAVLPEFEKHLVGVKKGENKKFSENIMGDNVDFDVTIDEVWKVELPEVDDKFAENFGHKDAKNLKDAIKKSIKSEKEMSERQIIEEKVLNEILKKAQVEIPESLISQEISRRVTTLQNQMGPGFNKFLETSGKKIEDLQKDIKPAAEKGVKISLVLSEIAKDLGYFDSSKLGKDMAKNHEMQQESIQKTLDKLIEIALK